MTFRRVLSLVVSAGMAVCVTGAVAPSADAVTDGSAVAAPSRSVPWVLSLHYSKTAGGTPQFICSASALAPREVLTAAHCVQRVGFYFVKVGAERLKGGRLIPVEAVVDNSRYSKRLLVNDLAVLRPLTPLGLSRYPRLAKAALTRQVNGVRPPVLTIYGWGLNQNRRLTGQLLKARLQPQARAAAQAFGPNFRPKLMLAAGKYHPVSRTYSGACYGDSGGPLVVTFKRVPHVVGVTSFGRGCNVKAPTVFTTASAYRKWIGSARGSLPRAALHDNRALPVNTAAPAVTGTVALGSALTCAPGAWSSNATSHTVTWYHDRYDDELGTGPQHVVTAADAGEALYCEVAMSSDAGRRVARSAAVAAADAPSTFSSPTIGGLPGSGLPAPGTVATCSAPTYAQPGVSSAYSWSVSDGYGGAGTALATGPSITLTEDVLRTAAGRYLTCAVRSSNAMGSHLTRTDEYMPSLRAPSIYVSVTPSTVDAGTVASCNVSSFGGTATSVAYQWAIQSGFPGDTIATGAQLLAGTGSTYTVTAEDRAALTGKYLVCQATASSWQGSDTDTDGNYVF